MSTFSVYSLADTKAILSHPSVGQCALHQGGTGKIVISASGDLSSHTTTANGFVVVNRLKSENGVITIEVPQNSAADTFLRKWVRYLRTVQDSGKFAKSTLTVTDQAGKFTIHCAGVTPQKVPDRTYDRSSTNVTYTLLAVSIAEK